MNIDLREITNVLRDKLIKSGVEKSQANVIAAKVFANMSYEDLMLWRDACELEKQSKP